MAKRQQESEPVQANILDERCETEHRLIGCAIIGNEDVRQSCAWLKPERFHDELLGTFWRRFVAGEPPLDVAVDLGRQFYFDATGWTVDLPSFLEAEADARRVAALASLDESQTLVAKLAAATARGDHHEARQIVQELARISPPSSHTIRNAIDVGNAFLEALDMDNRVIPTHIPPIDRCIAGGLERQTLSILAARPSMGKSCLGFQIARNVAAHGGKVLFVSLEMSETNLWARAACGAVGLSWADVKVKRYSREQRAALERACADLMFLYGEKLLIHDRPATSEDIWEMATASGADVVIVDHLRFVGDETLDNENKRLGMITGRAKQMAKQLDCHVMILAQLNRQTEARGDQRPQLSDLRDSGEIEENADLVLMPFREDYYDPKKAPPKLREAGLSRTELWVRKARDGQINAKICLIYSTKTQWFDEPTPEQWPLQDRM